jgi:phosphoglycerate dehydrogenase-like enzyme
MQIAVLDDYQKVASGLAPWHLIDGAEVTFLHRWMTSEDEVVEALSGYDVVVAMRERTKFPREVLRRLPRLRLLVTTGMINRSIDVAAASAQGVLVCGTPWAEDATVEVTWAHILALAHRLVDEDASLRRGAWQSALGTSLKGKVLGLLGLGTIGSKVAAIGQAFGMRTLAYSPNLTAERAAAAGAECVSKDALFERSDVLSVHLILADSTRGIVGARELSLMKPSAFLVNTSRGPLVDEPALAEALRAGRLAGAGVDVFSQEPIPLEHPLLKAPNTVLSPHIGYVTREVYQAWYEAAVEDILAYAAGTPLRILQPH